MTAITMDRRKSWAQNLITCYLCDKPALRFCNSCQADLCLECIGKHVEPDASSPSHDIVPYKNRQPALPTCDSHADQRCQAHCKQCHIPICTTCFIGPHKGHDAEEYTEIVKRKTDEILTETEEIKDNIIPKFKTTEENIGTKITEVADIYNKEETGLEKLREIWLEEVNSIFDQAISHNRSMKKNDLAILSARQTELQKVIPVMIDTIKDNKQMLKENKALNLTNYKSKLSEYKKIYTDVKIKCPCMISTNTDQGRQLRIEADTFSASLTRKPSPSLSVSKRKLLSKARLIATIPTDHHLLNRLACVGTGEAWISGYNIIATPVYTVLESDQNECANSTQYWPLGISVTLQGEMMYSDSISRTVNIVRNQKSKILITTPKGWEPGGLCCITSEEILVNMHSNNGRNKIVRYQGRKKIQTVYRNERGWLIFSEGTRFVFINGNNSGDIYVSDPNSKTVVLVETSGTVRFRYDGVPSLKTKPFDPSCLASDSLDRIIVVDKNNDCLHILDKNGNFLICVDNCGIDTPFGLRLDNDGRLWVGLTSKREIKVIEYLK